jgi:type I site-specific restriction endonuclease
MKERETRKKLIDPLLGQAGWVVVSFSQAKRYGLGVEQSSRRCRFKSR